MEHERIGGRRFVARLFFENRFHVLQNVLPAADLAARILQFPFESANHEVVVIRRDHNWQRKTRENTVRFTGVPKLWRLVCTLADRLLAECLRRLLLARSGRIVRPRTAQHAQDLDPGTDRRSAVRALPRHRHQEGARHSRRPLPKKECTSPTESCAGADSSPLLEVHSSHQTD